MERVRVPLVIILKWCVKKIHYEKDIWFVDPPITHPNVFEHNTELFCDVNETPTQMLQQTSHFTNPLNIDMAPQGFGNLEKYFFFKNAKNNNSYGFV